MSELRTPKVLVIDARDNVGVALEDLQAGQAIPGADGAVSLRQEIRFGHKFAVRDIREGEYIIKYGAQIGIATSKIVAGDHVHVHNVRDIVDEVRRAGRAPVQRREA
jgi:membrane protein implicated in regulation of membrane protease activity